MESNIVAEAGNWYQHNWDPDLSVGEWFQLMYEAGWAYPTWPDGWGGKALPLSLAKQVRTERRKAGALAPPSGVGPSLLSHMLFKHGTPEQQERLIPAMAYGGVTVCQMLSEPDAGSDLAGSRMTAVRDGDEWVLNGSKIWTSNIDKVDFGMLVARSNWDVPKHAGLTFFMVPAKSPGITSRPIKQMNGDAEFNLVHYDDVRVEARNVLGAEGEGWKVTRTFITYEKNIYNPSAHEGGPYHKVDLDGRAGDLQTAITSSAGSTGGRTAGNRGAGRALLEIARSVGATTDPIVRQDLARAYTIRQLMSYSNLRLGKSSVPGSEGAISKLMVSHLTRLQREIGLRVQGPYGTLLDDALAPGFQHFALSTPANSIAGGTDEIQRNHLAEKVLGLPREPAADKDIPYSDVPHGASWNV